MRPLGLTVRYRVGGHLASLQPCGIRGVVEHSVYVAGSAKGRGVGRSLVAGLIAAADEAGIWTIQSSIFPENASSLALHERAGFRVVGRRERIAQMTYGPWSGLWRDTILIERRSAAD